MRVEYYAHSAAVLGGAPEPLKEHLTDVAARAALHAQSFGAEQEAHMAGLLHDLGKYGHLFQRRLEGKEKGIDHWSAGAWAAITKYCHEGIAAALAIQGHHIGLQQAAKDSLRTLDPKSLEKSHPLFLRPSEVDTDLLLHRLARDEIVLPAAGFASIYQCSAPAAAMLDVRMLFSALVDADFIETEAHFDRDAAGKKRHRQPGHTLDAHATLAALLAYIETVASSADASQAVKSMRGDLLQACLCAADSKQGLFTLTAPTGSGKTLSMLAFALRHAERFGLRRIVTVLPYLTIIDQTVGNYRKAIAPLVGANRLNEFILEHHSLAGAEPESVEGKLDGEDAASRRRRELAENWDSPLIVTTSVQFLESLFSNRPAACRKLHRLAASVILFDEVQTLPVNLAIPTLAALSRLAERYGATVVFSTATQPAFTHLDEHVRKFCVQGWRATEVVPASAGLFGRTQRASVIWPELDRSASWKELADQIAAVETRQVLCILNLKRHALTLFQELRDRGSDGLFHLSTNMCPAHRRAVLLEVRARLLSHQPCHLVSTQCVEAGVDVDFPEVFRAFAPLDAIIQAAGRCNRNHLRPTGALRVFVPEEEAYPDSAYAQAAGVTRLLLKARGPGEMNIDDPGLATTYYRELYSLAKPQERNEKLREALRRQDFADVASLYRLIPNDAINVLVPYDPDAYAELAHEVREINLNRRWILKARSHTVNLFRPKPGAPVTGCLESVPVSRNATADDWFIYLRPEHYDPQLGLLPPQSMECLIA
ncbi:MAG: CRISPR-associated endonuclease Cas3'' [Terriglobia bacterium]|jgi:CRISPR-associated helicase Cas3/CRISPR-associated endonuclease Cas3-HD